MTFERTATKSVAYIATLRQGRDASLIKLLEKPVMVTVMGNNGDIFSCRYGADTETEAAAELLSAGYVQVGA